MRVAQAPRAASAAAPAAVPEAPFVCALAAALATALVLALSGCGPAADEARAPPGAANARGEGDADLRPRVVIDLSGPGWRLWLDRDATWEQDELFAPPVAIASLPVNPPNGGFPELASLPPAAAGSAAGVFDVRVPGTVEQYAWDALAAERAAGAPAARKSVPDTAGDYVGVSWWWREFDVPAEALAPIAEGPSRADTGAAGGDGAAPDGAARASAPRHVELQLQAVRQRAEVFVNERLVGYDVVGNTPFRVNLDGAVHAGRNRLAVRITDPGGNFSWEDFDALHWGRFTLPSSHGFGGITGAVRLVSTSRVHLQDLWVRNRPDPHQFEVVARVVNPTDAPVTAALALQFFDASTGAPVALDARRVGESCPPGETEIVVALGLPGATLWTPETPQLYVCRASLATAGDAHIRMVSDGRTTHVNDDLGPPQDVLEQRFGLRWFDVDGVRPAALDDAVFRLNGRRIVLCSAISWGFWPGSGLVPTPELARAQVEAAKALGLNMLNHHRTLASPGLLDAQDELGLLAYEEPGGYAAHGGDAFCAALAREKLLRMVERDRSHPSLVIVNLINEETTPPTEAQRADLADAHALDPTRVITFTSGWGGATAGEEPLKLHARPHDPALPSTGAALSQDGWSDEHAAPGPGVWRDEFWKGPDDYRGRTDNHGDIVFRGEEGAIASPPRLALIREALDGGDAGADAGAGTVGSGAPAALERGWDGTDFCLWADGYRDWLQEHGGAGAFPGLDALTRSLGDVAQDYQARMLENVRLGNVVDGYVINGWEDEKLENHSGIVDTFRRVKGDPARLARSNAPLLLVVKLRQGVVNAGEHLGATARGAVTVTADIGLVNERDVRGPCTLAVGLRNAAGAEVWHARYDVDVAGGDTFGQMLATDIAVTAELQPGMHVLGAELRAGAAADAGAAQAAPLATGSTELLVVDWKSRALPPGGAFLEKGHALKRFFDAAGWKAPPVFHPALPPLAWVLVGDYDPEPRELVPESATSGWLGRFRKSGGPDDDVGHAQPVIDFEWSRQEPQPGLGLTRYDATFTGSLRVPESGDYVFHALSDDGVRVWLDSKPIIEHWESHSPAVDSSAALPLVKDTVHDMKVEYWQGEGEAVLKLFWTTPDKRARTALVLDDLLRRAREDGTSVVFLDKADRWAPLLVARGALRCDGVLEHGRYWEGGGFFARTHPLLAGLPADGALSWPFQDLVKYDARRFGLRLHGDDAVVGCVSGHEFLPATALGIVPCGKGRVLLNTLDLVHALNGPPGSADVVRTLLGNILDWAAKR